MTQITKVHGTHNGIQLITNGDGEEVYYSTRTKKCAIGTKGIARHLGCNGQSILNQVVKFGKFKEAQLYTQYGIKLVKFIVEDDLNDFYNFLLDSRMKKETKSRIREVQGKYVQAGFRLHTLMQIAPEQAVAEIVDGIKDVKTVEKIVNHTAAHAQYLRSHIAINYEAPKNGLKTGKIVGENNLAVNLPYSGGRGQASTVQKVVLTTTQLHQASALNAYRKEDADVTVEQKYDTCDKIRQIQALALQASEDIIAAIKAGKPH